MHEEIAQGRTQHIVYKILGLKHFQALEPSRVVYKHEEGTQSNNIHCPYGDTFVGTVAFDLVVQHQGKFLNETDKPQTEKQQNEPIVDLLVVYDLVGEVEAEQKSVALGVIVAVFGF